MWHTSHDVTAVPSTPNTHHEDDDVCARHLPGPSLFRGHVTRWSATGRSVLPHPASGTTCHTQSPRRQALPSFDVGWRHTCFLVVLLLLTVAVGMYIGAAVMHSLNATLMLLLYEVGRTKFNETSTLPTLVRLLTTRPIVIMLHRTRRFFSGLQWTRHTVNS